MNAPKFDLQIKTGVKSCWSREQLSTKTNEIWNLRWDNWKLHMYERNSATIVIEKCYNIRAQS